ncbi:MAG: multicopper oxidase domain-containing protein, partial [Burkholderiales bacterium]
MSSHRILSARGRAFAPSRRQFVSGVGAASALAGLGLWPSSGSAEPTLANRNVLAGTEFDLTIGETPVNFTGRSRIGTTVNGSIPAPLLRWREGDEITLRVTNRLPVTSSIH